MLDPRTYRLDSLPCVGCVLGCLFMPAWIGCADEPTVTPEQRMRVVTGLDPADRTALADARFEAFRDAVLQVRRKEAERPQDREGHVVAATDRAAFNMELETVTVRAITIMRADDWTAADKALMNRAMRSAQIDDLQSE